MPEKCSVTFDSAPTGEPIFDVVRDPLGLLRCLVYLRVNSGSW